MKSKVTLLLFVMLVLLSLVACQKDGSTDETPPILTREAVPTSDSTQSLEYPGPSAQTPPESEDPGSYPFPQAQPAPSLGGISDFTYPNVEDGGELSWFQARSTIMNGYVVQVVQTHELKVLLTLEDGRTLITYEPNIDDVLKIVEECGELCKDVVVATE